MSEEQTGVDRIWVTSWIIGRACECGRGVMLIRLVNHCDCGRDYSFTGDLLAEGLQPRGSGDKATREV